MSENNTEQAPSKLIACPDCGRMISRLAPACPQCGRPATVLPQPIAGTATPVAPVPGQIQPSPVSTSLSTADASVLEPKPPILWPISSAGKWFQVIWFGCVLLAATSASGYSCRAQFNTLLGFDFGYNSFKIPLYYQLTSLASWVFIICIVRYAAFVFPWERKRRRLIADLSAQLPSNVEGYNQRGVTFFNLRAYENAVSDFSKAIDLNPKLASAYRDRAIAYEWLKRYNDAWSDLSTAKDLGCEIEHAFAMRVWSQTSFHVRPSEPPRE